MAVHVTWLQLNGKDELATMQCSGLAVQCSF
jgi:hypothetical protein